MRTRLYAIAALCFVAFGLCGCPLGPQVRQGNWVFSFYDNQNIRYYIGGLALKSDGTTAPHLVQGNGVQVTTGWWIEEGVFTLEQKLGSIHIWYIAEVESPTWLEGVSYDVNRDAVLGSFTAIFDDGTLLQQ